MPATGHAREDVRDPADRRVSRTRRSIDEAFLALLQCRGYEAVGVSDIVREADVGRATFYEHYASKDDLLRAQLRQVAAATIRLRPAMPGKPDTLDATRLFAHVRDVPVLHRLIAGRSATARSLRVLQGVLEERVGALLAERLAAGGTLPAPWTPAPAARVVVAGLCALVAWWTEQGLAVAVDEVQAMFEASARPMLGTPAPA
ncbi:MAG: TetR/AcrR family transcriptional regulator [Burkholderiaceae bacterium]